MNDRNRASDLFTIGTVAAICYMLGRSQRKVIVRERVIVRRSPWVERLIAEEMMESTPTVVR